MIYKTTTTLVLMIMFQAMACTHKGPGWQLDVHKSKLFWNTGQKVMGGHSGYLLFASGHLLFSASGEPVSGTFHMDMNSIRSTDNPDEAKRKRTDADLRNNQFFASAKHPLATMDVKKITRIDSSINYTVAGNLTIKGITHPIEFKATIDTKNNSSHIIANVSISHLLWGFGSNLQNKKSLDSIAAVKETLVPYIHISLNITMNR